MLPVTHGAGMTGERRNVSAPSIFVEGGPYLPRGLGLRDGLSSTPPSHRPVSGARASPLSAGGLFPLLCKYLYKDLMNKALKERLSLLPIIAPRAARR